MQNLQFLTQLCPKYHIKPEDSHQSFEYILCKNCNSSSTGRHAKLSKRKLDFNKFAIDVIIIHWTPWPVFCFEPVWTEMKVHIFQNIASTNHISKGLKLQKMKTDVRKKKIPKCLTGCQSLPQKLGFSIPLQPIKIKSLILCFGRRPPAHTLLPKNSYVLAPLSCLLVPTYSRQKANLKHTKIVNFLV